MGSTDIHECPCAHTSPSPYILYPMSCLESDLGGLMFDYSPNPPMCDMYSFAYSQVFGTSLLNWGKLVAHQGAGPGFPLP